MSEGNKAVVRRLVEERQNGRRVEVAEGDKVATLKTFSGTHEGELMGLPPIRRRVAFDIFDLLRIRDGKVVEHWGVYDIAGLMQQLGATSGAGD